MKSLLVSAALGAGFLFSVGAYADAPAGSTAQCKDGTYYSGASHRGACKGHEGVKEWLDKTAATPAAKPAAAPAKKSTAAKTEAAPAATPTAAATSTKKTNSEKTTAATAAPPPATATPTAPEGATAQCKDGTYVTAKSHKGACRGHQGVKAWLDNTAATAATKPAQAPKAAPATVPVASAPAAATPTAPEGATAQCKDGTYYTAKSHKGACKGHQGVRAWLDNTAATAATHPVQPPKAAPATAPAATAPAATAPAATATRTLPTPASQIQQKTGGGAGLVWVNSDSKVYHCQGDEWYGKTKEGSYMSEPAATAGGNRAARGKECGK